MNLIRLVLVVPLLMLACASAPRVRHPEMASDLPDAWAHEPATQTSPDTLWWTTLGDPQLQGLVEQALEQNLSLRATAARVRAAAAQAKMAGAPLYPQVGAGFNAGRRKQNFIGLPIPGAGGVISSKVNSFGVSLDVSWEIDLWGRLGAAKSAALAELQASRADLRGARLSLAAQTAKAWFAAVEAKRQVDLSRASVENLRTSSDVVRARYERGLQPSLDLRLALSSLAGNEALLHQRQVVLDRSLRQLELLLGRYPGADITPGDDLPTVSDEVPAGLPADLVARRPDLVAAERRLAAAGARVSEARRSLYPRISLTGSGGTSSNELGDLLKGDFTVWSVVGNIVAPLFQGGRLRAQVDLAESQSRRAVALYAQSVLRAYGEVEAALTAEGLLKKRQNALETAAEQALAARRLAEERYATGLANVITMLDAQRRAYDAESQLLAVRRQRLENRIDLHLALGGGFAQPAQARDQQNAESISAVRHTNDGVTVR
jgi:NodT family efflux transporter outer membrane factor (OMF) lipoprotein